MAYVFCTVITVILLESLDITSPILSLETKALMGFIGIGNNGLTR